MYPQVIYIAIFLLVIACLPWLTKWLVRRNVLVSKFVPGSSKLVSVLAVGPSQRVVTVEVGPENDRTWLVLGVTAQHVTLLHRCVVDVSESHGQLSSLQVASASDRSGYAV